MHSECCVILDFHGKDTYASLANGLYKTSKRRKKKDEKFLE